MNTYKNKWNSLYQKDQFFDFLNDECDLEDDVLSEGATVKSINFDCSIQFNMEKSGFKTKRIIRWEKINLEHTHAIEWNEALLNSQSISNSPLFLTKKVEESKSNNSRVKNAPCTSPISLKDEIRQLLRWLVRERNISESKAERKDLEEMPKVENYNWCNLDVDIIRK